MNRFTRRLITGASAVALGAAMVPSPALILPKKPELLRPDRSLVAPRRDLVQVFSPLFLTPVGKPAGGAKTLFQLIQDLGLTTGLKLCLDAGDAASYTSGQSWLSRATGGYDFFRGATVSGEASDPTFNGTVGGLTRSTYWSFDGGDYFRYDTTNEAWMNNFHKDSAKFTILVMFRTPASIATKQSLCGTDNDVQTAIGFWFGISNAARLVISWHKGSAPDVTYGTTTTTLSVNTWYVLAITVVEATPSFAPYINGASSAWNDPPGGFASPSAAAATNKLEIGAGGAGGNPLLNGARVAAVAMWEGTGADLSAGNHLDLSDGLLARP